MQERRGQTAIGATVEVDHIIDILTRVAMHEQPGPSWAALLALLGIAREPPTQGRVADGKVEPIAEPDAESPIGPALGPVVATAERLLRFWLAVSPRVFKEPNEPICVDRHFPGGPMQDLSCRAAPGNRGRLL